VNTIKGAVWVVLGAGLMLGGCGGGGGSGSTGASTPSASPSVVSDQSSGSAATSDLGGTGRVTLSWSTDPTNVDGSCTTGIRGYRINMGLAPGLYSTSLQVDSPQLSCTTAGSNACGVIQRCTYTIETLTSASWYITTQSVDFYGNRSGYSNEVVATVYGG